MVMTGVLSAWTASYATAQIYVDLNATGVEDGTSWCTAYRSLSAAIAAAAPGDSFLIADGVYKPNPTGLADPRDASFVLPADAKIGGALAGCGAADPDEIDPLTHLTILSGDLNGDDGPGFINISDNCYHVLRASGGIAPDRISLRNLIITGGNADGPCCGDTANGGGLSLTNVPETEVQGCIFRGNAANRGGAISSIGGALKLDDTVFQDNLAAYDFGNGGAVFSLTGTADIRNCLFIGNHSIDFGGAILNGSIMSIMNSTIAENVADEEGGGVFNANVVTITDSILWENRVIKGGSSGEPAQVANISLPEALVVDYTCIQGLTGLLGGVGNIGDDPDFRPGPLDNYYLANGVSDPGPASPCVDAGSDSAVNLSLDHLTTSTGEEHDIGVVDMGYHRPISGLLAPGPGDGDHDGDVDLRDVAAMQSCFAGPDQPVPTVCRPYEYDGDSDIDELDYPPFSLDLTGP